MSVIHAEEARHEVRPPSRPTHVERPVAKSRADSEAGSAGALYAHALAIAQEAIARYQEFAMHVADRGNDAVADLFSRLADLEGEHAFQLSEAAAGKVLPKVAAGEYAWLYSGPQVRAACDFIFRMMTSRQALEIALRAEMRAKRFFEQVLVTATDSGVRQLAIELWHDEDSHVAWLRDALARMPEPFEPGEDCAGDPTAPQAL